MMHDEHEEASSTSGSNESNTTSDQDSPESVGSNYDRETQSTTDAQAEPDWRGLPAGPERQNDLRPDAGRDARRQPYRPGQRRNGEGHDDAQVDHLAAVVLARLQTTHFHLPIQPPDPEALARLKAEDANAYAMWMRLLEKRVDHDMEIERLSYTAPYHTARRGQVFALIVVLAMFILAGYAFYLDHAWAGAALAAINLVALAAIFAKPGDNKNPEH